MSYIIKDIYDIIMMYVPYPNVIENKRKLNDKLNIIFYKEYPLYILNTYATILYLTKKLNNPNIVHSTYQLIHNVIRYYHFDLQYAEYLNNTISYYGPYILLTNIREIDNFTNDYMLRFVRKCRPMLINKLITLYNDPLYILKIIKRYNNFPT